MFVLDLIVLTLSIGYLTLEVVTFFESAFTLSTRNLSLEELNLILGVVQKLLLSLELSVEVINMCLEVAARGHVTLDLTVEVSFLLTQFEEVLRVLEKVFLLHTNLLL